MKEDIMRRAIRVATQWLIPLLLILISQKSVAGVMIEEQVKSKEGRSSTVFLYYSESQLRTDHPESGLTTIMDFKENRMVMVDHRSKSYVEVKLSQWEKDVAEQLKKEIPGIKPEERKITVKKTGESATINGFKTEKIQVFAGGELIEDHWVTRDADLKDVEKVMDWAAQGFSKEFRSEMKEGQEIYTKLKPYGFPIQIKDYSITYGLKPIDVMEVKRIERKELKDDTFSPPSGYVRITPQPSKK
jgi:hypothetical protein